MFLYFLKVSFAVHGSPLGSLKMLCLEKPDCASLVQLTCLLLDWSAWLCAPPTASAGAGGDQGVLCINFLVVVNVTISNKFSVVPSVRTANKWSCCNSNVMQPTQERRSHLRVSLHGTEGCWDAVGDDQGHCQSLTCLDWLQSYWRKLQY